jgi:N-acyl homoserine lactone hydrolase
LYFGSIRGFLPMPNTPFHGYAILRDQGVVLVDTGFGPTLGDPGLFGEVDAGGTLWPWVRRPTAEALADHGLRLDEVTHVINTHLGDHSGENLLFPNAIFFVQRSEVEHTRRSKPHLETWDFPGARLELLEDEDAEVLPGIHCVFTPGHTPGHQSVLVNGGRSTLIVGDAIYTAEIWAAPETMTEEHPAWFSQVAAGYDAWRASADKLHALDADVVHFAHDAVVLER